MAGRPPAPTCISDNIVPFLELCDLQISLRELVLLTSDNLQTIKWLARHGLIANRRLCDTCEIHMAFQARRGRDYVDGYCWSCRTCRRHRNLRLGSFFKGSHFSLTQLVDIIYWWSMQQPQVEVARQTGVSCQSLVDWYNFIRDICAQYLVDHPVEMGGPGKTVEIDESKFMHRKYHRGRYREGQWVLGMVERDTNLTMMVPVDQRDAATLLPIIAQYVRPGTRIVTDGWQAYNGLPQHVVVNHRYNFVDPNDPTVHTNRVEGSWGLCKVKFRAMRGTSEALFSTHLQEFLWRCAIKENVFGNILFWIRHYYDC